MNTPSSLFNQKHHQEHNQQAKQKVHVIKIGGNVLDSDKLLHSVLDVLARHVTHVNKRCVLIHGGGGIATSLAARMGLSTTMIDGRRVTDEAMLRLVTMVYAGWLNKSLVAGLQARGCQALGLSGVDGNLICSRRRAPVPSKKNPYELIDYGFVGDVQTINVSLLHSLLNGGITPVIAPITHDRAGTLLNTNADTVAAEIASALAADTTVSQSTDVECIFCFEKQGVLRSVDDDTSRISCLTPDDYAELKASAHITKGMIPKLDNAFATLASGVRCVRICHADVLDGALRGDDVGTLLVASGTA